MAAVMLCCGYDDRIVLKDRMDTLLLIQYLTVPCRQILVSLLRGLAAAAAVFCPCGYVSVFTDTNLLYLVPVLFVAYTVKVKK